jgi:hypothetical protein
MGSFDDVRAGKIRVGITIKSMTNKEVKIRIELITGMENLVLIVF